MLFSFLLQTNPQNLLVQALPILAIFGIFYFLLFLPMQKQKKQQKEMIESLKPGDTVVTSGGIVGTVTAVDGDLLVLRVKPDNLKLQFSRSSVSSLAAPTEPSK